MKKYALLVALIISALNGMDNQNHTNFADHTFSQLLKIYDLPIENRSIFHIGCTVGIISAELAQKASRVHVFDQNKKFIDAANNKYQDLKNISFTHCNPTNFHFPRQCDLAIIDYTVLENYAHISERKKELCECLHQHISQNGEIFLSITTSDNIPHPTIDAAREMAPTLHAVMPNMTEQEIINLMIPAYPSLQELVTELEETDFEIISTEELIITRKINMNEFSELCNNQIIQSPIYGCMKDSDLKLDLAQHFVQSYLQQLHQFIRNHVPNTQMNDQNGDILEPTITTVIRARKK